MDRAHQAGPMDRGRRRLRGGARRPSQHHRARRSSSSASWCPRSSCTRSHTGVVANAFGDDTAKRAGRLTLNPAPHVDPVGTLIVPALLSLGRRRLLRLGQARAGEHGAPAQPAQSGRAGVLGRSGDQRRARRDLRVHLRPLRPGRPALVGQRLHLRPGHLLRQPGQRRACAPSTSSPCRRSTGRSLFERLLPTRYWPTYLRYRQYTMPILLGARVAELLPVPARPADVALQPPLQLVGRRARALSSGLARQQTPSHRPPGRRSPPATSWAWAAPRASTPST